MSGAELVVTESTSQMDLGGMSLSEVLTKAKILPDMPHNAVVRAATRVNKTGILQRLNEWRLEDGMDHSLGGRPIVIHDLAILTGLMLLAGEKKPLLITELRELFQYRLSAASREFLDLPGGAHSFLGHLVGEKRWYNNTHNAFHRIVALMNPYPYDLRSTKSHVTIREIMSHHDEDLAALMKGRLDEFTERFLLMTFGEQPHALRLKSSTLSVSFDQTYMESPTRKAYSRVGLQARAAQEASINDQGELYPGAVDVSAGYYVSSGGVRGDDKPGTTPSFDGKAANKGSKGEIYQVGYAANIAIRVDSDKPSSNSFPYLAVAMTLSIPNVGTSEEAVSLLRSAVKTGLKPGVADGDKDYFANALHTRLHDPAVALGFTPSTDYRKDREYIEQAPGGALYINDGVYCPATPTAMQTATKDHLNNLIDDDTFRARINARLPYRLIQKEKPDAKGKVPMMCPALGASPTVVCPIREMMKTAAKKQRPEIEESDIPGELDRICRQHSVSFEKSEIDKRSQSLTYGSPEWEKFHKYARNSVESLNAQIGRSGSADIETASRRRARGIAAAQVFATFLLVQHNLSKIADFLKEKVKKAEGILARKLAPSPRRRDFKWKNPYTGTSPSHRIPILPDVDQPLRT